MGRVYGNVFEIFSFFSHVYFVIGNEEMKFWNQGEVKFWNHGDVKLEDAYPNVARVALDSKATISDYLILNKDIALRREA